MKRIVISDTSCLIILSRVNLLEILPKMFSDIWITEEIRLEFGESLPDWISVKKVKFQNLTKILELNVDKGEASAMALYLEQIDDAVLVIDEKKGRQIAKKLGIKIIGTLGILVNANRLGLIEDLKIVIENLEQADFRISPGLKAQLLSE